MVGRNEGAFVVPYLEVRVVTVPCGSCEMTEAMKLMWVTGGTAASSDHRERIRARVECVGVAIGMRQEAVKPMVNNCGQTVNDIWQSDGFPYPIDRRLTACGQRPRGATCLPIKIVLVQDENLRIRAA